MASVTTSSNIPGFNPFIEFTHSPELGLSDLFPVRSLNTRGFNSFHAFIDSPELRLSDLRRLIMNGSSTVQVDVWATRYVTVNGFQDSVDITRIAERIKGFAEGACLSQEESSDGLGCVTTLRNHYAHSDRLIEQGGCFTRMCSALKWFFDRILSWFSINNATDLKERIMMQATDPGIAQRFNDMARATRT